MFTKTSLTSVSAAQQQIMATAKCVLTSECVSLFHSRGRVLSGPVVSTVAVPPADNSAMDGYALRVEDLNLNVITYIPKQTAAHRDVTLGGIPGVNDELHDKFTEQVKLEPFRRALDELKPDVWFNAIRKDQTEFRQGLDVLSLSKDGVLKVAPLFEKTDSDLDKYLDEHNLPNEFDYFDPTKVEEHRECGLHTQL